MKKIRSMQLVYWLLFVMLILTGCVGEKEEVIQSPATPVPTKKHNIETLAIYSINSDSMTLMPVSVKKGTQDLSPSYVAALVLDNLNEKDITISDIYQKGKKVIVSFDPKGKPVKNCSDKMETLILEAFANSLLDNVNNCTQVIFQCDGKEYKSSQYSFEKNEVFASE